MMPCFYVAYWIQHTVDSEAKMLKQIEVADNASDLREVKRCGHLRVSVPNEFEIEG